MRRALPWIGLFLLTISFVWFVRQRAPLYPEVAPRSPARKAAQPLVVVLDPGHGGQDSGAMCGEVMEKDLTLDVALRAGLLLRAEGYATVLTRENDRYLSLGERAAVANRQKDALFVSIHFNDKKGATVTGVETYYARQQADSRFDFFAWLPFLKREDAAPLSAQSESLARFIQTALVARTRALNRGTKAEQFFVIANVRHPAALVEGGFITTKSEVTKLASAEYREQIASAISEGIDCYREGLRQNQPALALAAGGSE
jgi:N-acetylmuramoyl-L-alanine amidase